MKYTARLTLRGVGDRSPLLVQEAHHQEGRTHCSAVMLLVVRHWVQIGINAHILRWRHRAASPMNSDFRGRWDSNRTGNLRYGSRGAELWSVPLRSSAVLPFLLPEACRNYPQGIGEQWILHGCTLHVPHGDVDGITF